jgi:hypothetical protein
MDPAAAVERSLPAFSAVRPGDWSALEAAVRAAGVPASLAAEVVAFVPIAFGRALLDGMAVEFSPEYATPGTAAGRTAGPLADHPVYAAAAARAAEMLARQEGRGAFVDTAVWSAELAAVNEALHAGSDPANLVAGPPLVTLPTEDAPADPPARRSWWRPRR